MGPAVVLARSESASFYMAAGFAPAARFPAFWPDPTLVAFRRDASDQKAMSTHDESPNRPNF